MKFEAIRKIWPWVVGGMLVVVLYAHDYRASENGIIGQRELWGRDFINMWTGGKLIAAREYVELYTPESFAAFQESLFGALDRHIYSYPPVAFPLSQLLSNLPYGLALVSWIGATAALYYHAVRPWVPAHGRWRWLAFLTPAALLNIWEGHYGFLIGALFVYGWRWLDTKPVLAGMAIGLLIIKPQFAILVPVALLLRGDWRAIFSAAAMATTAIGLSVLYYGLDAWKAFLELGAGRQAAIDAKGAFFGKLGTSAATAIMEIKGGWSLAIATQIVFALLGLALVVMAARKRVATWDLALLTATCTFLVLPYGLSYDLTVVAIGAWVLMNASDAKQLERALATIGFVAPQVGIICALVGLPIMPLMLAGLAIAQYSFAIRTNGEASGGRLRPAGNIVRSAA